jgi:tRNA(adenine34) deaminase
MGVILVPGEEDRFWMARALLLADRAALAGEVPVGAVIVSGGQILGEGWNQPIRHCDPTAHAEIVALRAAVERRQNYRLPDSTLYVTLEPCPMCAGAIIHARITRVFFAASDPRTGAGGSVFNLLQSEALNHRCQVDSGILAVESGDLLRQFFAARRHSRTAVTVAAEEARPAAE